MNATYKEVHLKLLNLTAVYVSPDTVFLIVDSHPGPVRRYVYMEYHYRGH